MNKKTWLLIVFGVTFTPAVYAGGGEQSFKDLQDSAPLSIGCNLNADKPATPVSTSSSTGTSEGSSVSGH